MVNRLSFHQVQGDTYIYIYIYIYIHTPLSTNNGDARFALASDFKGKIRSQQNKQKSGTAACVPLYSAVPKRNIIFLHMNRTPVDRQEAMLYKNLNKKIHMMLFDIIID